MLQDISKNKWVQDLVTGTASSTFFNIFQGRCTFAAICFSTAGVYGWLHGKDLTSFALFVTAVQGLLVAHSLKEDIHEQRMAVLEISKAKAGVVSDLQNDLANVAPKTNATEESPE
jgi:hypothetical protein